MHKKLSDTFSKYETIVLVGWWTGWHIQPIITIAWELSGKKLLWIGGKNSNESVEAKKYGIPFEGIKTTKLATTHSPKVLLYPWELIKWIREARKILKKWRNGSCVFSKGGPWSVAIGIAAWSLRIPLYIHESDTIPWVSNKILSKIAKKIFLWFESTTLSFPKEKVEVIWQILHRVFSKDWKEDFIHVPNITWKTEKPHILVICWSQWAKDIFEAILDQFGNGRKYEWIISLGKLNQHMKSDFEKMQNTEARDWISQEDIASLLPDTDIAITRGSATTLAEIDAFHVKKIIIPLPIAAKNHQYWNALEYEMRGDILLEQKDIESLKNEIEKIWQNSRPSNI
jgi:UDP-N-acetylglucosamine--N-acetylmuramyl-(pentapeptide) pyrophosphoryl-undecaprenol N-acetylglucosamine transferase